MQETGKKILDLLASLPPGCWGVLAIAALGGGWVLSLKRHKGSIGGGRSRGAPSRASGERGVEVTPVGLTDDEYVASVLKVLEEQFIFNGLDYVRRPDLALELAAGALGEDDSPYSG